MHSFGFPALGVEDAWVPSQFFADSVRFPCCPVIVGFSLAGIGQLVAVATGEDAASIEDRYPTATTMGRTEEPRALPAKVASCPVEIDGMTPLTLTKADPVMLKIIDPPDAQIY